MSDERTEEAEETEKRRSDLPWRQLKKDQQPSNNAERAFHAWRLLRDEVGVGLIAVRDTGVLYACHDGVWQDDGEQVLRERSRRLMASDYSTSIYRELHEQVRADAAIPWEQMGLSKDKIAIENGLLDIRERKLRDLRPTDYALSRFPVSYHPDAGCPRWKSFLANVTDGEAACRQLQEFVGYCLAGGKPWLKKALMILGPTDAGKTIFLETIEALFGFEANAGVTPQYLANQRWGEHRLEGSPVNIRHDVDSDSIHRLGILKEIIDGNPVKAERKGEDPYTLKPKTRHLFAANRTPQRVNEDRAFWNRWLTVVFPESVPEEEQQPKRELLGELEAELPGILNWALDGYDRLTDNGGFTEAPAPEQNRRLWEEYGSPVERFKTKRLVRAPGEAVPMQEVRNEFTTFCLENDHEDLSDQELTRKLTRDPAIGKGQRRINGERPRVYTGIQLEEDSIEGWEGLVDSL